MALEKSLTYADEDEEELLAPPVSWANTTAGRRASRIA